LPTLAKAFGWFHGLLAKTRYHEYLSQKLSRAAKIITPDRENKSQAKKNPGTKKSSGAATGKVQKRLIRKLEIFHTTGTIIEFGIVFPRFSYLLPDFPLDTLYSLGIGQGQSG
jgi:hypothetical protein